MLTVNFHWFSLMSGQNCLDVGCGEGRHALAAYLRPNINVIGLDLSATDLSTAKSRISDMKEFDPKGSITFIRGNATNIPFPDASFDRVICSEVLEHIPNYISVIEELNRVLKPGGNLCVSVPRAWPEWLCWKLSSTYQSTPGGHIRIFNRTHLRREITRYGLTCYHEHGAHALHVPYWWLRCLFWNTANKNPLVVAYHRLLMWDLTKKPALTQWIDKLLNPWMGKSIVLYFNKPMRCLNPDQIQTDSNQKPAPRERIFEKTKLNSTKSETSTNRKQAPENTAK